VSKILVTGGAGYIGSVAAAVLIDQGHDVVVFDDLSTGHKDAVDPRASFIEGSLLDLSALKQAAQGCAAVMHFAGKSLVGESTQKPDLYREVNVGGTANLLAAMNSAGVERLVFSSSAATYGQPTSELITEGSPAAPTNPYGQTKLEIDQMISASKLSAISLRYFNVAGALKTKQGWISERHANETHLIPNVLKATSDNPLKIFGTDWDTPDGTCVRDYVHVVDLIDAHILALDKLTSQHEIINIGSGRGNSVREVISASEKVLGRKIATVDAPRRDGDPARLVASIDKAKKILGWAPARDLTAMIADHHAAQN
jgi:UDP-glucose 4-epimerase